MVQRLTDFLKGPTIDRSIRAAGIALFATACAPASLEPHAAAPEVITEAITATTSSWNNFPATAGYRARQAEYLAYCAANNGPNQGGTYGQLCRLATNAGSLNETAIRNSLNKINNREDTADFSLTMILRMLALYGDSPTLDPVLKAEMVDAVLNFKYWLDEPGPDMMCWWSENHQILFHAAEYVAGQLFRDELFPNAGMTGQDHIDHALPLLHDWLDRRGMFGFSEWHSNIYFNEDMPPLINLVDLAEDETIAAKAAMVLDVITFDFANTHYKGIYATAHGRTYPSTLLNGSNDSTSEATWILLGLGTYQDTGHFTGVELATSPRYWPPPVLEDVALDAEDNHVHKQRDGIDVAEGPDYGIGYESPEDIMFYWGMSAYAASEVISGTLETAEYYDLWDNYFFSDIAFLQPFVGAPWLEPLAAFLDDVTRGPALEAMSTYVYRTPDYQLSGAQDYNPGMWAAQQHIWQATLDLKAFVFTTAPGGLEDDYMAGPWTGGWLPRATFHENVGILQYQRDVFPVLDQALFVEYTHAYFPRSAFDEVQQVDGWTFGKKGDGYVALYSDNPTTWATTAPESDYELIADGRNNVWIVELGSQPEWGDFQSFVTAISNSSVSVGRGDVQYFSPSQGIVEVSRTGPMFVNAVTVDIGPYERWDNRYARQTFGTQQTVISLGNQRLELDFEAVTRTYTAGN